VGYINGQDTPRQGSFIYTAPTGGIGVSTPNARYAIDLHHVEKIYRGKVHALRGIEMQVHPGEIFGLLGPNGAGKSTLVKIMMTVVRPTRAEGMLLGRPIGHKATLQRVGFLPEHHRLPPYLTGRQALDYCGALAKVDRPTRRDRAEKLLEAVGMSDWADKKVASYSKGMQQRIGLAQALINDPQLVILDEPTDGVDPVGRREIRDVLVQLRNEGRTIFLNSHLLSELEMVCDRVAILVQGEVTHQGTIDDLTVESRRYEIAVRGEVTPGLMADHPGARIEPVEDGATRIVIPGAEAEAVQPVLDRLRAEGLTILSIRPVRESLEDLLMRAVTSTDTGRPVAVGARAD
jgi:ABC-2 type transport system ATP-binding protein